ncbi:hypothetical protein [Nitrospira sp. M1]
MTNSRWFVEMRRRLNDAGDVWYHIGLVSVSAMIAMLLPYVAQGFLTYWELIESEKVYLVSVEITVAITLIILLNFLGQNLRDSQLARSARGAGLVHVFPGGRRVSPARITSLIKDHGFPRHVMIIGSTGNTFVDPAGDLHPVLKHCLEAKILLLNPSSANARARARSILHPEITLESLMAQTKASIDFLKLLRATQKNVRVKFYSDDPNVKLAILGDNIWLQHYHTNLDIQCMPMYAFQYNPKEHGLYTIFYQHFVEKWEHVETPEYDLETDDLVYRWGDGTEKRRIPFSWDEASQIIESQVAPETASSQHDIELLTVPVSAM